MGRPTAVFSGSTDVTKGTISPSSLFSKHELFFIIYKMLISRISKRDAPQGLGISSGQSWTVHLPERPLEAT